MRTAGKMTLLLALSLFTSTSAFVCDCGDDIGDADNDGDCDCPNCEDEDSWTCTSCAGGCPTCGGNYITCSPSSGGDPFTTFHGKTTQYWPPLDTRVKLLQVDDVKLFGVSEDLRPETDSQWFQKLILAKGKSDVVVTHSAPATTLFPNSSSTKPNTLIASVVSGNGWHKMTAGHQTTMDGQVLLHFKNLSPKIGKGVKQALVIQTAGMNVTIHSAKAQKFKNKVKQIKYVHLDMEVNGLDYDKATGVLPEIWGLRPMTTDVKAMMQKPAMTVVV
jgi:hypothetical protein